MSKPTDRNYTNAARSGRTSPGKLEVIGRMIEIDGVDQPDPRHSTNAPQVANRASARAAGYNHQPRKLEDGTIVYPRLRKQVKVFQAGRRGFKVPHPFSKVAAEQRVFERAAQSMLKGAQALAKLQQATT